VAGALEYSRQKLGLAEKRDEGEDEGEGEEEESKVIKHTTASLATSIIRSSPAGRLDQD
jgi:hypothetical protein